MAQTKGAKKQTNAPTKTKKKKYSTRAKKPMNAPLVLAIISLFQIITASAILLDEAGDVNLQIVQVFAGYIVVEWAYFLAFKTMLKRQNFELEFIAFFLCGVGLVAIGSINQDAVFKQFICVLAGLLIHILLVFLMGNVDFCMKLRLPAAIAAIGLLAINLLIAGTTNGARNWIEIGSFTIQPSEFVKVAFIFVGSSTLTKIQTTKNTWAFLGFAVACIGALFLMRDFGTALIFFFTFLIIAFMNSGDIRTIIYSCAAGILGAIMIAKFRPHVKSRFEGYRHVWEYMNENQGYQQTRVLIGMASGGLLGVGIGGGNTKHVFAAENDLIFGVICEEWGLIFGLSIVLVFAAILLYTLFCTSASRSTFYSIAACAAAGLLVFQASLNIFGITDILPLTGVTLPFISQGGSSMMCCWGLLAFIKAGDPRTYDYLKTKTA